MLRIPAMVDLARTPEDWANDNMSMPVGGVGGMPKYYYGLNVAFEGPELEKLGLKDEDIQVGDLIHINGMAEVTSISKTATESGERCRMEVQLQRVCAEDEDTEGEEGEEHESAPAKLYTSA